MCAGGKKHNNSCKKLRLHIGCNQINRQAFFAVMIGCGVACAGSQDGSFSPSNRNVHAPVTICVNRDSLHMRCWGAGMPASSRQIEAIDRAASKPRRIHIVRLIHGLLRYEKVYHCVIWSGKSSSSMAASGKTRPATDSPAAAGLLASLLIRGCQSGKSLPSHSKR